MDSGIHIKESATITEIESSDDENFVDACPSPSRFDNDKIIDELIDDHKKLLISTDDRLKDEKYDSNEKDDFTECETITEKIVDDDLVDDESQRDSEKDLTEEERLVNKVKSEEYKNEGNLAFRDGDYEKSIKIYTQGLRTCPVDCGNERSILYGNRAAAKVKIDAKESAIQDCTKSLEFNPIYVKSILRYIESMMWNVDATQSVLKYKYIFLI